MQNPRPIVVAALFVLGCGELAPLPEPPVDAVRPKLTAITPTAAWSGDPLVVTISPVPAPTDRPLVAFPSGVVVPATHEGDTWTVLVPDDAGTGLLSLVTTKGRVLSDVRLTYRGLGRLRERRHVVSHETTITFERAVAVPDSELVLLLHDGPAGVLVHSPYEGERFLPLASAIAPWDLAVADQGETLWIFGQAAPDACPGTAKGWVVPMLVKARFDPRSPEPLVESAPRCFPAVDVRRGTGEHVWAVAFVRGTGGEFLVAVATIDGEPFGRAFLADAEGDFVREVVEADGIAITDVFPGPGNGFSLMSTETVLVVDPVLGTGTSTPVFPLRENEATQAGGWLPDGRLLVGTSLGRVRLVHFEPAYGVVDRDFAAPSAGIGQQVGVRSIAVSADGRSFLAAHPERSLARSFLVGGDGLPVASVPLGYAGLVTATDDGRFLVSGTNALAEFSQGSGAFTDGLALSSRIAFPAFHTDPCGSDEVNGEDPPESLGTVLTTFGDLAERDPRTLLRFDCVQDAFPRDDTRGLLVETASAPFDVYWFGAFDVAGLARFKAGALGGTVPTYGPFTLTRTGDEVERATHRQLHVSQGGRLLAAFGRTREEVLVFDATDGFPGTPASIHAGRDTVRAFAFDDGRVVVVSPGGFRSYRVTLPPDGTVVEEGAPVTVDGTIVGAAVSRGRLVGVIEGHPNRYFVSDLATGSFATIETELVSYSTFSDVVVGPTAREAYVLQRDVDSQAWLDILDLDHPERKPVALLVDQADGEILTQLALSRSGERLVVTDLATNRLHVLE